MEHALRRAAFLRDRAGALPARLRRRRSPTQEREIAAIAGNADAPTFANTVDALEMSGATLRRVSRVFFNLTGAHTNEDLEKIERDIAPVLAKHRSAIFQNEALFRRVDALKEQRDTLGLSAEQKRVLERLASRLCPPGRGARRPEKKKRLAEITERLAVLGTQFGQNVLADERAYTLLLEADDRSRRAVAGADRSRRRRRLQSAASKESA